MRVDKILSQPAYQRSQISSVPSLEEFIQSIGGEIESLCLNGKDISYEEFKSSHKNGFFDNLSKMSVTEKLKQQIQDLAQNAEKVESVNKREIEAIFNYAGITIAIANDGSAWYLQNDGKTVWVKMEETSFPEIPQD